MAVARYKGQVWLVKRGKLKLLGGNKPAIRGGSWVSIRDAMRIFDRPRSAIQQAVDKGLIRTFRRKVRGPFPAVFVLYEDVETWAARTPHHGRQISYRAQPIFGPVPDPENVVGGVCESIEE